MAQFSTWEDLTQKQRNLAEILANPDIEGTITDKCKIAGVDRKSYYNWIKKPEFVAYVNYLVEKHTDAFLSRAWSALCRKAESGDTAALKLFFEMKNQYRNRVEVTGRNGGPLVEAGTFDLTAEEKRQLLEAALKNGAED